MSTHVILDSRRPTLVLGPYSELTRIPYATLTVGTKDGAKVEAGGASVIATGGLATLQLSLTEGENLVTITASDVTFEAVDAAGNLTRDVRNVTGTIDNSAPAFVSLSYSPSSLEVGGSVSVSLALSDASSLGPTTSFSLGGPGGTLSTTLVASNQTYTGTISVPTTLAGGTYTPNAIVLADILGNVTTVNPSTSLVVLNSAPSAPTISTVTDATTGGRLTVAWSTVSAADLMDYVLYEGPSASGPWMLVASGSATSAVRTPLIDGTKYYYYVAARDIAGNASSPSGVQSGTPSDQVAPSTPVSVNASPTGTGSISVSWSPSSGASSYKVYRSLSPGGGTPWSLLGQTGSTSFNVTGLASSTTYHFSVTALDNNTAPPTGMPNESTVGSNSISATTL